MPSNIKKSFYIAVVVLGKEQTYILCPKFNPLIYKVQAFLIAEAL